MIWPWDSFSWKRAATGLGSLLRAVAACVNEASRGPWCLVVLLAVCLLSLVSFWLEFRISNKIRLLGEWRLNGFPVVNILKAVIASGSHPSFNKYFKWSHVYPTLFLFPPPQKQSVPSAVALNPCVSRYLARFSSLSYSVYVVSLLRCRSPPRAKI